MGKKTEVLARISTVAGERGSSDTLRDIRGFALKFKTEEGNWDFVGNDLPVFFIRDPIKFPSLNRSHKRHPQTGVADASMFWDFHNNNQEGVHTLMQLFGPRGVPASLKNVNAFGNHTFKFGKVEDGTFKYVKIHFKPTAGIKTLTDDEAIKLAGSEPDYHIKDMYNSIAKGDFPQWTMYLQVMDPKDAENYRFNPFDITKTWSQKDYPLQPVGKLTLTRNADNYFAEIEQAAFSPSTLIPGIGPSPDPMLHARMFSYPDAARYRVGPNYQQLPCNAAKHVYAPYQRDGPMRLDGNYGADPDYGMLTPLDHFDPCFNASELTHILVVRSTFRKVSQGPKDLEGEKWVGQVQPFPGEVTDEDFIQPRDLWELFKKNGEDEVFIKNLTGHVGKALPQVQKETVAMFRKVNDEIADRLQKALDEKKQDPDHLPPTTTVLADRTK